MTHSWAHAAGHARRLFTGSSPASRAFELLVLVAAAALAAATMSLPPPASSAAGPGAVVMAGLAVCAVALGGLFVLPLGDKIYLSLGSTAAFATLLVFPPRQALPLALVGTLIANVVRRRRGARLTPATIVFNLAQYVVTWSLAAGIYRRLDGMGAFQHPVLAALPVAVAGAVYFLVNTWLVTTRSALRRRAWTWDLWIHAVQEAATGYLASLSLGAAVAGAAAAQPVLLLWLVPHLVYLYRFLGRMSRIITRLVGAALETLVEVIEQGDPLTAEHSERVAWWAERLARHLDLPADQVEAVTVAAKLHDLGKIILPGRLEQNPGPLTDAEWGIMRRHPAIAAQVIGRLPGFRDVADAIRHHHEHYDGQGYPAGLAGGAIPLGARIIAVADAFDAMTSPRAYRPALSHNEALAEIGRHAGTQLDPRVAAALLTLAPADKESAAAKTASSGLGVSWEAASD